MKYEDINRKGKRAKEAISKARKQSRKRKVNCMQRKKLEGKREEGEERRRRNLRKWRKEKQDGEGDKKRKEMKRGRRRANKRGKLCERRERDKRRKMGDKIIFLTLKFCSNRQTNIPSNYFSTWLKVHDLITFIPFFQDFLLLTHPVF